MKKLSKTKKIVLIVLIHIALLIPYPIGEKDGGTMNYIAILWSVTKYHRIDESYPSGYYEAT